MDGLLKRSRGAQSGNRNSMKRLDADRIREVRLVFSGPEDVSDADQGFMFGPVQRVQDEVYPAIQWEPTSAREVMAEGRRDADGVAEFERVRSHPDWTAVEVLESHEHRVVMRATWISSGCPRRPLETPRRRQTRQWMPTLPVGSVRTGTGGQVATRQADLDEVLAKKQPLKLRNAPAVDASRALVRRSDNRPQPVREAAPHIGDVRLSVEDLHRQFQSPLAQHFQVRCDVADVVVPDNVPWSIWIMCTRQVAAHDAGRAVSRRAASRSAVCP